MADMNTPFYRPTPELWAAMACMVLSGMAYQGGVKEVEKKAAIEEEREACAGVADAWVWPDLEGKPDSALASRVAGKIARKIRARSDVKP